MLKALTTLLLAELAAWCFSIELIDWNLQACLLLWPKLYLRFLCIAPGSYRQMCSFWKQLVSRPTSRQHVDSNVAPQRGLGPTPPRRKQPSAYETRTL